MSQTYTIVIPMAGLGTRMRPHTWSKPKPLISLAGKTVLDFVLEQFQSLPNFDQAQYVLIVGANQKKQIEAHIQKEHSQKKVHIVVQDQMLGQSHALHLANELVQGPMLMSFSDTLIETDLSFLENEKANGIAWVRAVPDPRRFGVAVLDKHKRVTQLIEKPTDMSNKLAVVGFYYFREAQELMHAIELQIERKVALKGEYFLVDAINIMLEHGCEFRSKEVEVWLDAGKPDALLETNRYLLEHGHDNSQDAKLRRGATILSPVFIDESAIIEGSVVGPYVSIGAHCEIKDSIVRDTIVEGGAVITKMVLERSLIGRNACIAGRAEQMNIGDDSWIEI